MALDEHVKHWYQLCDKFERRVQKKNGMAIQQTSLIEDEAKQVTDSLKGYAATPGSYGDTSKTCRMCGHYAHKGDFRKCGLMRDHWTNGKGADIKASAPACRFFIEDKKCNHLT